MFPGCSGKVVGMARFARELSAESVMGGVKQRATAAEISRIYVIFMSNYVADRIPRPSHTKAPRMKNVPAIVDSLTSHEAVRAALAASWILKSNHVSTTTARL